MDDLRLGPEMRIRDRAYLLWDNTGRPEGRADEFWEQAQRDEARAAAGARIDEEARESFPVSGPPSQTGTIGEGRCGR